MRVALAQLNPVVGHLAGNRALIEEAARKAEAAGAKLVVFPELALTGYPPMDLLERDGFVRDQLRELDALGPASQGIDIVLGAVLPVAPAGAKQLQNCAVLLRAGRRAAAQAKTLLPTYDVFDENRYFVPAARAPAGGGRRRPPLPRPHASARTPGPGWWATSSIPTGELAAAGAGLIVNVSASPFHVGKAAERRAMVSALARRHGVPILFCNQVGGNDELVFDGASFAVDAQGRLRAALPHFETALEVFELETGGEIAADPEPVAQLEAALVLGIRDYFRKQNLPPGAVIGLSGGVDSALTAQLAVEALGAGAVVGLAMPGPFSSAHSVEDALALGRNLGIPVRCVDIRPIYEAYLASFRALFGPRADYGLTQQNVQSRIRGALLMAVSNAENRLVLATGNKSELSVGYCTLYGDTVGGLAVLGDVYKRDVYALARHANRERERIPERTLTKPPSAELAPGQLDSDDLPAYEVLDAVLHQAIEGGRGADSLEPPPGTSRETALGILRRLDRNEYKRRQAPLVLRVSPKAFGSGRRLPIVQRYEG